MKFRTDFVTNSSSSSFICYAIFDEELYEQIDRLLKSDKANNDGRWAWDEILIDKLANYKYVYVSNESTSNCTLNGMQSMVLRHFKNLSPEEKDHIKELIEKSYCEDRFLFEKFWDKTDGYSGYYFNEIPNDLYCVLNNIKHNELFFSSEDDTIFVDCELLRKQTNKLILPLGYKKFKLKHIGKPYDDYLANGIVAGVTELILQEDFEELDSNIRVMIDLESVTLNSKIKVIPKRCFEYLENLREIHLTDSITTIEEEAFSNCSRLREISLIGDVKYIDSTAFEGCKRLTIICHKGSYVDDFAKKHTINIKYIGE